MVAKARALADRTIQLKHNNPIYAITALNRKNRPSKNLNFILKTMTTPSRSIAIGTTDNGNGNP